MNIEVRKLVEYNTDPQGRCYNGCHARSEFHFTNWEVLEYDCNLERLKFWQELNAYAVSQRGQGARREYRLI